MQQQHHAFFSLYSQGDFKATRHLGSTMVLLPAFAEIYRENL